jgi:hypothetical protein
MLVKGGSMRTLAQFLLVLLASSCLFAQNRGGSFSPPSIVIPSGGAGVRPGGNGFGRTGAGYNGFRNPGRTIGPVYAYPVYVGGYYGGYYGNYYDGSYDASYAGQQAPPQQGSVTVIYPPQPAPVIINQFGPPPDSQNANAAGPVQSQTWEQPDTSTSEPPHYLIAFKDHTIYSAVAYWVDGDTLHYFTTGNTHNQVSVSLVDRELTARLNKDSGVDVKLPPAK